jgi:hypothetical protein
METVLATVANMPDEGSVVEELTMLNETTVTKPQFQRVTVT